MDSMITQYRYITVLVIIMIIDKEPHWWLKL